MKSVRNYLREEVQNKKLQAELAFTPTDEEAEFQRCLEINEKWNSEIVKVRDERIASERLERIKYIGERLEDKARREQDRRMRFESQIKKEKEISSTFITRENIDKAIEDALAMKVDYNFAVNLEGKIFRNEAAEEKK
jgi:small subunit ribosomal protein S26